MITLVKNDKIVRDVLINSFKFKINNNLCTYPCPTSGKFLKSLNKKINEKYKNEIPKRYANLLFKTFSLNCERLISFKKIKGAM